MRELHIKRYLAPGMAPGTLRCNLVCLALLATLLTGCAGLTGADLATPLPADYLPTVAAMTLAARGIGGSGSLVTATSPASTAGAPQELLPSATPPQAIAAEPPVSATPLPSDPPPPPSSTPIPTETLPPSPSATTSETVAPTDTIAAPANPTATHTPAALVSATDAPVQASPTASLVSATPTATSIPTLAPGASTFTPTPGPAIPEAHVQIYQLGERSKVISPINVITRLMTNKGKVVRIELHGEDGRVLARHVRTYTDPWDVNKIGVIMDFEINAPAELGRLVVSVEDQFNRLTEVNSVDLILIKQGSNELNPASALWQRIVIQEPAPKALIQSGTLIVTGRALPFTQQPLKVLLVAEDGRVLGQRLAGVSSPIPGDYGNFITEVPYSVTEVTPALLVIFEDGGQASPVALLASLPVVLAP